MLRYKLPSFSSENTVQVAALSETMAVRHFFDPNVIFYPIKRSHGQCGWAKYTGAFKQLAMVLWSENFERSFVKDLSNSLKTFINFATLLQNY